MYICAVLGFLWVSKLIVRLKSLLGIYVINEQFESLEVDGFCTN